jgi:DNA mismatch repair protein MutL
MPGVLRKRIVDVLGKSSNDKLVPIEESTDIVTVNGYVGKPEFAKKTRGEQFLFVNNRFFKDTYFNHAITRAFEGLIPPKHFPTYFLYLEVDPSKIDVNVHPTKTEIKFEEDSFIYKILLSSIRQALGKYNIAPTLDFDRETSFDLPVGMRNQPVVEPVIKVDPEYNPFKTTSDRSVSRTTSGNSFTQAIRAEGFGDRNITQADWEAFYKIEDTPATETNSSPILEIEDDLDNKQFIFNGKYIVFNSQNGLTVIDSQRAFERVIYNDLMGKFITSPIPSQQLLFPFEKILNSSELSGWEENAKLLERFGFSWNFVERTLNLTAVPAVLQEESINDCIDMIIEKTSYQTIDPGEIAHALVLSIAVSSGRSKKNLNNKSAKSLLNQLFQSEDLLSPEGKTIISVISNEELNNRFK